MRPVSKVTIPHLCLLPKESSHSSHGSWSDDTSRTNAHLVLREGPGPTALHPDFRNDRNGKILAAERFGMQGRKMEVRKQEQRG